MSSVGWSAAVVPPDPLRSTTPRMTLHLTKHHGLGNDFLVALERANPGVCPDPARSVALCDRHLGVGADGVLYGLAGSTGADLEMVLHNSDGSAAEISGNGIRCLAQAWLRASFGARDAEMVGAIVVIDTPAGRRTLEVRAVTDSNEMVLSVDMGRVGPGPDLPGDWDHPGLGWRLAPWGTLISLCWMMIARSISIGWVLSGSAWCPAESTSTF